MSHTATTPADIGPAPWRPLFLNHLSKFKSPEFVLSTLQPSPTSPTGFIPRARFCIFRGFFAQLPENPHGNPSPLNPRVYDSDLLTFTSDVRMEKIPQLFATGPGKATREDQCQGSGGGGPVEAVFWVAETGTQWRIRGDAFVLGPDIEDHSPDEGHGGHEKEESSGVRTVKSQLGERMRVIDEHKKHEWSWARELDAHFGNLAPGMRGTFKNPAPGSKVGVPVEKSGEALGQKVTGPLDEDEVARKNFRVVVIRPVEVEQLELTEPDKARRWRFTYVGPEAGAKGGEADEEGKKVVGEWRQEELWP